VHASKKSGQVSTPIAEMLEFESANCDSKSTKNSGCLQVAEVQEIGKTSLDSQDI